jgi:hypothetical protein
LGNNIVSSPEFYSVLSAVVANIAGGPVETTLYQNQRIIGTAGVSSNQPSGLSSPYAIGAQSGGSGDTFWRGNMVEVLVYNTALSSAELQKVYAYLQGKYGNLPGVPQIDSIEAAAPNVVLHFKTQANRPYLVQSTESLTDKPVTWTPVTNLFAIGSDASVTVTDVLSTVQRFYRLAIPALDATSNASPGLVTQPATQIAYYTATYDTATFNGTVLPNGSDTTYWFQYGTDTNYGQITLLGVVSASNTTPVSVAYQVTQLSAGTNYHFQLVAFNNSGVSFGSDQTFSTPALPPPPIVQTLAASSVSSNSAVLNGNVFGNGSAIAGYFQYGLSTNYGSNTTQFFGTGNPAQDFNTTVAGLVPSTTYHYRIIAFNAAQEGFGNDVTFTTSAPLQQPPPTVQTLAASFASSSQAQLNGSVNPNGDNTTAYFEYGLTSNYGMTTPEEFVGSGSAAQNTSGTVGLAPNTTYHYRVVAFNSGGTSLGSDVTVTTASNSSPPTATTLAASSITTNFAILNGTVNPNGTDAHSYFQYGTDTNYGNVTAVSDAGSGTTALPLSYGVTLASSTTYHYRIVAYSSFGTSYGPDVSFTTAAPPPPPTATTLAATSVTAGSAILNASVDPNGTDAHAYFQYGLNTSYSNATAVSDVGAGNVSLALSELVGLAANTTYHFRVVAYNTGGTNDGADLSLITSPLPPAVTTEGATGVDGHGNAVLNASVNPNGGGTTVYFQYGLTASYGSISTSGYAGAGTTPQPVGIAISSLDGVSYYHYRAVAYNNGGTSYGADQSFNSSGTH